MFVLSVADHNLAVPVSGYNKLLKSNVVSAMLSGIADDSDGYYCHNNDNNDNNDNDSNKVIIPLPSKYSWAVRNSYYCWLHNRPCRINKAYKLTQSLQLADYLEDHDYFDHNLRLLLQRWLYRDLVTKVMPQLNSDLVETIYLHIPHPLLPEKLRHNPRFLTRWLKDNAKHAVSNFTSGVYTTEIADIELADGVWSTKFEYYISNDDEQHSLTSDIIDYDNLNNDILVTDNGSAIINNGAAIINNIGDDNTVNSGSIDIYKNTDSCHMFWNKIVHNKCGTLCRVVTSLDTNHNYDRHNRISKPPYPRISKSAATVYKATYVSFITVYNCDITVNDDSGNDCVVMKSIFAEYSTVTSKRVKLATHPVGTCRVWGETGLLRRRTDYRLSWTDNFSFHPFIRSYRSSLHGADLVWFSSGQVKHVTNYTNNTRKGNYQEFFESGKIRIAANYRSDELTGRYCQWLSNFNSPIISGNYLERRYRSFPSPLPGGYWLEPQYYVSVDGDHPTPYYIASMYRNYDNNDNDNNDDFRLLACGRYSSSSHSDRRDDVYGRVGRWYLYRAMGHLITPNGSIVPLGSYRLISIMDYTDGNVYMPDIIDVYDDNTVISFEEIANKLRQLQQQQQDYSVCW